NLREEIEQRELREETGGVRVMRNAQQRHVDANTDHTRGRELAPGGFAGIFWHDRDALESPVAAGDRVEQTAIVLAVPGIRPDEQRVPDAVGVENVQEV